LERVDVLVAPTTARTAPRFDEEEAETAPGRPVPQRYNSPMDLTGLPALALPIGFDQDGLPVSCQIVGRPFDEATVLRVAHAYEQATPWHKRHPELLANGA